LLVTPSDLPRWEHQRLILNVEMGQEDVVAAMALLVESAEEIARRVQRSKAKDDERGPRIIPDYAQAHRPSEEDPVVRRTWDEVDALKRWVRTSGLESRAS
jgi:hypothetical protein